MLLILLAISVVVSAALGPARISPDVTAGILLAAAGIDTPLDDTAVESQRQIILSIRLPRILTALMVGAALAMVGAVMQAIFRNPMADPGIIGVSSGAGFGAVSAIATGFAAVHWLALPTAAFAGALLTAAVVFLFSLRAGRTQVATLLLGGIAITYLCSAATSAVISFTYDRDALREMIFWLLGGFDNRSWQHVQLMFPPLLVGAALIYPQAQALNLLSLGEEEARGLGVRVQRVRALLLVVSALLAGVAVSVSGLVGFVGLLVPHFVRLLVGPDHRSLLPLAALGGGIFLLLADTAARTVIQPSELRVGIVTALVGAPAFLFILARQKSHLRRL